jgi:molecular chaperone GrpE
VSSHKDKDRHPDPVLMNEGPAQERSEAQSSGPPPDEVGKLIAEKQELLNTLLRRQADFDNYRKRVERERQQDRHRGVEVIIEQILPALDAFDRALVGHDDSASAEYRRGFDLIRRQLWDVLAKQGLARIESVGQKFDPNFHHAIESVETSDYADGTVIDEMQPGYLFHERVLRPAMVRVAATPERKSALASKREN